MDLFKTILFVKRINKENKNFFTIKNNNYNLTFAKKQKIINYQKNHYHSYKQIRYQRNWGQYS